MRDDEVVKWLSEDEQADYVAARQVEDVDTFAQSTALALSSLAETRKVLAEHDALAGWEPCVPCRICDGLPRHAPSCTFATMPRPR